MNFKMVSTTKKSVTQIKSNRYFVIKEIFMKFAPQGELAQLARALDWQSRGQGFETPILHF